MTTRVEVTILYEQIPGTDCLRSKSVKQGYFRTGRNTYFNFEQKNENIIVVRFVLNHNHSQNLQSEFLIDCFFLDGFEITLIFLLLNKPISCEFTQNIFSVNEKFLRLSESDMNNVLAAPKFYTFKLKINILFHRRK